MNNAGKNEDPVIQRQQLEKACWNGWLPRELPECFEFRYTPRLFLWDVTQADYFIDLEYAKFIPTLDERYALNPYLFLPLKNLS